MLLVPVNVVVDVDDVAVQPDCLDKLGVLPSEGDADIRGTIGIRDRLNGVRLHDRHRRKIERPRINVPRIVLLRSVLEKLKLIAACAWGDGLHSAQL